MHYDRKEAADTMDKHLTRGTGGRERDVENRVGFCVQQPRLESARPVHSPARWHRQWLLALYAPGQNWRELDVKREGNDIKTVKVVAV